MYILEIPLHLGEPYKTALVAPFRLKQRLPTVDSWGLARDDLREAALAKMIIKFSIKAHEGYVKGYT